MKIVLDSNVIIAAHASHGLTHTVFRQCFIAHKIMISKAILRELAAGLLNKIELPPPITAAIIESLKDVAEIHVPVSIPADSCRDPQDLHVLGLAVAAKADCIITGDNDLLVLGSFRGIPVLSPRDFWDKFRPTKSTVHESAGLKYSRAGKKERQKSKLNSI